MPIQTCKVKGKKGWKWGKSGKCYGGITGKAKALKQARAIHASGWTGNVFCPTGKGGGIDPSCSKGGGSKSSGGVGAKFADMPRTKATSKEAKAWRKKMQSEYDNDPEFRAVVDSVTLFTQGDYQIQRAYSEKAITGKLPPKWDDSAVPDWENKPLHGNALADYKSYFKNQGDFHDTVPGRATYNEAGRALTKSIGDSPQIETPMYRGLVGREPVQALSELKVGDDFDVLGASSFTLSKDIAEDFSAGVAKGQGGRRGQEAEHRALIEVSSGAKALPVMALSPWDQQEVLTSGKFRIDKVEVDRNRFGTARAVKIVLTQKETWDVK